MSQSSHLPLRSDLRPLRRPRRRPYIWRTRSAPRDRDAAAPGRRTWRKPSKLGGAGDPRRRSGARPRSRLPLRPHFPARCQPGRPRAPLAVVGAAPTDERGADPLREILLRLPFGSAVALGGLVTSVHLVTPLVDTGEKPGTGSL